MRIYTRDQVCPFRFSRATWGAFSNFQPLAVPIAAGPWTFFTSEAIYQAGKFGTRPDRPATHRRSADAEGGRRHRPHAGPRHRPGLERPARRRHALGAVPEAGGEPGRNRRGAGRNPRPAHRRGVRARLVVGRPGLSRTATRDETVLGRLWMELRQQLRDGDPASRSDAWLGRIRVGRLTAVSPRGGVPRRTSAPRQHE